MISSCGTSTHQDPGGSLTKAILWFLPRLCAQPEYGLSFASSWHITKWNKPVSLSRAAPWNSFYLTLHRLFEALPLSCMCFPDDFFTLLLHSYVKQIGLSLKKKKKATYSVYVVARSRENFFGEGGEQQGSLDFCCSLKLLFLVLLQRPLLPLCVFF